MPGVILETARQLLVLSSEIGDLASDVLEPCVVPCCSACSGGWV